MTRLVCIALFLLLAPGAFVQPASAVSVDDLLNLRARGLSDAVLVALIEADGSAFHLSASDIERLRARGLSDSVIVAMLEADKRAARPSARLPRRNDAPISSTTVVVGQANVVVVPVVVAVPAKPAEPIYWGFGGNARPGSWTLPSQADQSPRTRR
jgi:hypothetical protein